MRYTIYFIMLIPLLSLQACYDDGKLKEDIEDLNTRYESLTNRVAALENQVKQINTTIVALQTTVAALERNVYVSNVESLANGYKLYFTDNTAATFYQGKDGADGVNGEDGVDGQDGINAPVIGVALQKGVYYWTITTNGETAWLRGEKGEQLRVTGQNGQDGSNGKDGEDGKNGADGPNGTNGKDGEDGKDGANGQSGVTPSLKIDAEGYWLVSLDGGVSYKRVLDSRNQPISALGKDGKDGADGADGQNGTDGQDGQNGTDGHTPLIVAKQYLDGVYYWTRDGKWITDKYGNRLKAIGVDGKDGKEVLAPALKIENGRWLFSTDGGKRWTDIGQATGNDGKDGENGTDGHTPMVIAKQYSDGVYYWTRDGKWITDEYGSKLKAIGVDGKDGEEVLAPALKIENGRWLFSTDGGMGWTDIGQATGNDGKDGENGANGDAFFQSVTQNDEVVTIMLTNGTMLQVPRYKKLTITFIEAENVVIPSGGSRTIYYTLTGANEKTLVKVVAPNGWSAKVTPTSSTSGSITIHAPTHVTENEITVLVYNGESTMIVSTLYCNTANGENTSKTE